MSLMARPPNMSTGAPLRHLSFGSGPEYLALVLLTLFYFGYDSVRGDANKFIHV